MVNNTGAGVHAAYRRYTGSAYTAKGCIWQGNESITADISKRCAHRGNTDRIQRIIRHLCKWQKNTKKRTDKGSWFHINRRFHGILQQRKAIFRLWEYKDKRSGSQTGKPRYTDYISCIHTKYTYTGKKGWHTDRDTWSKLHTDKAGA